MRRAFIHTILPAARPGAFIITGDLVDGKTHLGRGLQQEVEWQVGRAPVPLRWSSLLDLVNKLIWVTGILSTGRRTELLLMTLWAVDTYLKARYMTSAAIMMSLMCQSGALNLLTFLD